MATAFTLVRLTVPSRFTQAMFYVLDFRLVPAFATVLPDRVVDGLFMATSSGDRSVKVTELSSGNTIAAFEGIGPILTIDFHPTNSYATVHVDQVLTLYNQGSFACWRHGQVASPAGRRVAERVACVPRPHKVCCACALAP